MSLASLLDEQGTTVSRLPFQYPWKNRTAKNYPEYNQGFSQRRRRICIICEVDTVVSEPSDFARSCRSDRHVAMMLARHSLNVAVVLVLSFLTPRHMALAQSAAETAQSTGLLGTWAGDCNKPPLSSIDT